jgi:hypothetical protein
LASSRSFFARFLRPARGPGLGRLGQVGLDAGGLQLFHHKAPAGGRLQGDGDRPPSEPAQPLAQPDAGHRSDLAARDFAGLGVQAVKGDLVPMHVESAYDGHGDLLALQVF